MRKRRSSAFHAMSCLRLVLLRGVCATVLALSSCLPSLHIQAAVTTSGDVSPIPPIGGGAMGSIEVGDAALGSVDIDGGTALSVTGTATVGVLANGIGIVTLDGLGSDWTISGNLTVGDFGTASVEVSNLARLENMDAVLADEVGSYSSVSVDGFGTIWENNDDMFLGDAGTAIVEISGGARVLADVSKIGNLATSDGRVTISDRFTLWKSDGQLTVGDLGTGSLMVLNEARVQNTIGLIAAQGTATVEVSGQGSVWENSSSLTVGSAGVATLRVLDHGRVTSTAGTVASMSSSFASVLVDGLGSEWDIVGTLTISAAGDAEFTISNGGLVTASSAITIGSMGRLALASGGHLTSESNSLTNSGIIEGTGRIDSNVSNTGTGEIRTAVGDALHVTGVVANAGSMDLAGGEMQFDGAVTSTGRINARDAVLRFDAGLTNQTGSQLAVTDGTVEVFGNVQNNAGGQLVVTQGSRAVFHDNVTNNGQLFVMPGASAVLLRDLDFGTSSLLNLQLAGAESQSDFGQLQVAGQVQLAGTLEVQLDLGYSPQVGDAFQLLTAADLISGTFAARNFPTLDPGQMWQVFYDSHAVILSVIDAIQGDMDCDGDVDFDDIDDFALGLNDPQSYENMFGVPPSLKGDTDGNGALDFDDISGFVEILAGGSGLHAIVVPEPASVSLMALAVFGWLGFSTRRSTVARLR